MRICFVSDFAVESPGGAQVSMVNQMNALREAGHDVFVITPGKKPSTSHEQFIHSYIPIKEKQITFSFVLPLGRVRRQITTFLQDNHIDVVHTQSELGLAILARRIAQSQGIPVVATIHSFFWESSLRYMAWPLSVLLRLLYRLYSPDTLPSSLPRRTNPLDSTLCAITLAHSQAVNYVISPSRHQKDALVQAGLTTPCSVLVNPYASPPGETSPTLASRKEAHFVWIGRCSPEKRLLTFIEAINRVAVGSTKNWRVTIIGDGPDREKAQRLVSPVAKVDFRGKLEHAEVIRCMDEATLTVLNSYHFDNQPMVVAEACGRWRGVLYCDERLEEGLSQAGLRTASPSAEAIAAKMQEAIVDPAIAQQLSIRAKEVAPLFLSETYVRKIVPLYETLR